MNDAVINPIFAEKMIGLEELTIRPTHNCDIDFLKLTYLKKLKLLSQPYTIPVFLSTDEYNILCDAGVEIEFLSEKCKNIYLDTSRKIDDILKSLNISKYDTDKEKLDKILIYVMENLEYDPVVGSGNSDSLDSFYEDGLLYAVFNKDTAICGNYSALVEAIYDRVSAPFKSIIMYSKEHEWNLVNIDGELYYVDATWLDEEKILKQIDDSYIYKDGYHNTISSVDAIKSGNTDGLEWYMNNSFETNFPYHTPSIMIPSYVILNSNVDNNKFDTILGNQVNNFETPEIEKFIIDNEVDKNIDDSNGVILDNSSYKKVSICINGKYFSITIGALVGVLAGIGFAVHVGKKKNSKKQTKQDFNTKRRK